MQDMKLNLQKYSLFHIIEEITSGINLCWYSQPFFLTQSLNYFLWITVLIWVKAIKHSRQSSRYASANYFSPQVSLEFACVSSTSEADNPDNYSFLSAFWRYKIGVLDHISFHQSVPSLAFPCTRTGVMCAVTFTCNQYFI